MSVVVAVKTDKGFMLGADSQATHYNHTITKYDDKIFTLSDCPNVVVGGVGYVSEIQGVKFIDNLIPEINLLKDNINDKLIYTTVYSNILNFLRNNNRLKQDEMIHSNFIIAYKDKAWLLTEDGSVIEIKDYYAIGSGYEVALGSLSSKYNPKDLADDKIRQDITETIKSCGDNTIYVNDDVKILTTYEVSNND